MRQLSDTNNDLKKLQTSSESEDSPYCKSSVSMLEMQLPLQKQLLAKLELVNFYFFKKIWSKLLYEFQFDEKYNSSQKHLHAVSFSCTWFIIFELQEQPATGVFIKRCSAKMLQIYRKARMQKCDFNKDALQIYNNNTSV